MTTRERWYAYWHAKRAFERHNNEMITRALIYGQSIDRVDRNHPAHNYVLRAIEMAINPPMVIDPMLKQIWPKTTDTQPARRLP